MTITHKVSVVIPSYKRHEEVVRAIKSVLEQTLKPTEIIVCNDGPDRIKGRLLDQLENDRVRYITASRRGSASATRNSGIMWATGDWVALLDDDDVWRPDKLAVQFEALKRSGIGQAILAGGEAVFAGNRQLCERPSSPVPSDIPIDQALFCGYGGVHTSTLIAPRWAFEKYLFNEKEERHEDWTWMLRVGAELPLIVAPEVVCERYLRPGEGLSRSGGFTYTRGWYEANRAWMSKPARAKFVAGILSRKAAHDLRLSALPWLIREHLVNQGSLGGTVQLLSAWTLPGKTRSRVKMLLGRS